MLNKLERCYSHYSISQTTKQIKTFVECMIHMLTESTDCFSSSRLVFCSWVGLISFDLTFFLRNQARRKILGNWYKRNKLPNSCKPSLSWISSSVTLMKWEDEMGFGCYFSRLANPRL